MNLHELSAAVIATELQAARGALSLRWWPEVLQAEGALGLGLGRLEYFDVINRILRIAPIFKLERELQPKVIVPDPNREWAPSLVLGVAKHPHHILILVGQLYTKGKLEGICAVSIFHLVEEDHEINVGRSLDSEGLESFLFASVEHSLRCA